MWTDNLIIYFGIISVHALKLISRTVNIGGIENVGTVALLTLKPTARQLMLA